MQTNRLTLAFGVIATLTLAACEPLKEGRGSEIRPQIQADPSAVIDLHKSLVVLDAHLDTPALFRKPDYIFSERGNWEEDGTHVDLPRMDEGGLDGGFWVIYTPQGPLTEAAFEAARNAALIRQSAIREVAAQYKDKVGLALVAADGDELHAQGKRIMFQSMENAYPLGEDLSLLETFYQSGLRMIGPVHFRNNQFADSATDLEPLHDGLSPLGEALVADANRLGLILDGSHASDKSVRDMVALSTTPIVLSHSGAKAVFDHPRNVPSDLLVEVAEAGGVIHINSYGDYVEPLTNSPERTALLEALEEKYGDDPYALGPDQLAAYRLERSEVDKAAPKPRASFDGFMTHLLYVLRLVGPDHVGLGADWDGGGGVTGLEDVADLPKITDVLLDEGYTREDLAKIWGGNLMRVMREVEAARTADTDSAAAVN